MATPVCFGDSNVYDEERARCRVCPYRRLCVEEVDKQNGGDPAYYNSSNRTNFLTRRSEYTPQAQPQQQAKVAQQQTGLTPARSMVSYRPLPQNPVRELGIRVAMSGAAAIFDSLGHFFREDGYRLFEIEPMKVRCGKCQEVNLHEAKFCQGCGEKI